MLSPRAGAAARAAKAGADKRSANLPKTKPVPRKAMKAAIRVQASLDRQRNLILIEELKKKAAQTCDGHGDGAAFDSIMASERPRQAPPFRTVSDKGPTSRARAPPPRRTRSVQLQATNDRERNMAHILATKALELAMPKSPMNLATDNATTGQENKDKRAATVGKSTRKPKRMPLKSLTPSVLNEQSASVTREAGTSARKSPASSGSASGVSDKVVSPKEVKEVQHLKLELEAALLRANAAETCLAHVATSFNNGVEHEQLAVQKLASNSGSSSRSGSSCSGRLTPAEMEAAWLEAWRNGVAPISPSLPRSPAQPSPPQLPNFVSKVTPLKERSRIRPGQARFIPVDDKPGFNNNLHQDTENRKPSELNACSPHSDAASLVSNNVRARKSFALGGGVVVGQRAPHAAPHSPNPRHGDNSDSAHWLSPPAPLKTPQAQSERNAYCLGKEETKGGEYGDEEEDEEHKVGGGRGGVNDWVLARASSPRHHPPPLPNSWGSPSATSTCPTATTTAAASMANSPQIENAPTSPPPAGQECPKSITRGRLPVNGQPMFRSPDALTAARHAYQARLFSLQERYNSSTPQPPQLHPPGTRPLSLNHRQNQNQLQQHNQNQKRALRPRSMSESSVIKRESSLSTDGSESAASSVDAIPGTNRAGMGMHRQRSYNYGSSSHFQPIAESLQWEEPGRLSRLSEWLPDTTTTTSTAAAATAVGQKPEPCPQIKRKNTWWPFRRGQKQQKEEHVPRANFHANGSSNRSESFTKTASPSSGQAVWLGGAMASAVNFVSPRKLAQQRKNHGL